ncbi:MAG TPA: hypothetical protein VGS10_22160 [Terracidiphilus sp.]|nr:hypothetical protein [Terracidiphilus sp.]
MRMRFLAFCLSFAALPLVAMAQTTGDSSSVTETNTDPSSTPSVGNPEVPGTPNANSERFSRVAFGGGLSILGIHLLTATNLNPYLDLRGDGHFYRYTASNIKTSGFTMSPQLSFASAGVSLDVYPFPRHGFRVTPGLLFYNGNSASSSIVSQGGTSFKLNHITYYSSTSNPVAGSASLNLHSRTPAFTITTGWGNFFPSKGGHWSFPFEIGIALIGSPKAYMALTSGQVCSATGTNCVNVATDQQLQTDLQTQITKFDKNLDPLKTFPILGGGFVYNFGIRSHGLAEAR